MNSTQTAPPDLKKGATELRTKVETYLHTKKEELNSEGIQRDLQALFDDPKAGVSALKERLFQFVGEASFKKLKPKPLSNLSL